MEDQCAIIRKVKYKKGKETKNIFFFLSPKLGLYVWSKEERRREEEEEEEEKKGMDSSTEHCMILYGYMFWVVWNGMDTWI